MLPPFSRIAHLALLPSNLRRRLPRALLPEQIRTFVQQFDARVSGETEVEISELDGQTVLLRGHRPEVLERHWRLLCELAEGMPVRARPIDDEVPPRRLKTPTEGRRFGASQLLDSRVLATMPAGRTGLRGDAVLLLRGLDRRLEMMARQAGAEPLHLEPTWAGEDLSGFGYSEASPTLFRFVHGEQGSGLHFQNAACDNVWRLLAGGSFPEPATFTTVGPCARNEGSRYFLLERMRNFTMREVMQVGPRASVEAFRSRWLGLAEALAEELGLSGVVASADDPFFLGGGLADATGLPDRVKVELRLDIQEGRTVACASANLHGEFFARRWGYTAAGADLPWTACVAFGLERWVYAMLVQHGPLMPAWPNAVAQLASL